MVMQGGCEVGMVMHGDFFEVVTCRQDGDGHALVDVRWKCSCKVTFQGVVGDMHMRWGWSREVTFLGAGRGYPHLTCM